MSEPRERKSDMVRRARSDELFGTRDPHEAARRAVRGGALSVAAQAVRAAVEGVAILVLTRALLPAEFGLVDMIVSATGIVDRFKDFGLSSATIQKEKIEVGQVSLLFWINTAVGLVLTAIIMVMAPILALVYRRPELLSLTLVLSASTFLSALSVQHQALLRRDLRFGALAAIDTLSAVVASIVAVWLALRGAGAWALVARQLARLTIQTVLSWLLSGWMPGRPERANIGEFLRFGGDVSAAQLINYAERNVDNALVGAFAGPKALGFYSTAYGLMRVPIDQINNFSNVVIPALSRMLVDPERYLKAYQSVTSVCILLTVPLAPLSIYLADWFIPLMLGEQWRPSVPIFRWLALTVLTKPIMNTVGWLMMSQGRSREIRRLSVFSGCTALASFVIGLPWGAYGVAMSYAIVDIVLRTPVNVWIACNEGPVRARHAVTAALPAWTCAAVIGVAYPLVDLSLFMLTPPLRAAVSGVGAIILSLVTLLSVPWCRATLREGRNTLRAMRSAKK